MTEQGEPMDVDVQLPPIPLPIVSTNSETDNSVGTIRALSDFEKNNFIQDELEKLGLSNSDIEYILSQGKRFFEKPQILAKKLKMSIEIAKSALNLLKSSLPESENSLTIVEIQKIEECLKENPEYDADDIALMSDIEEALVTKYFLSLPLTPAQKASVAKKFLSSCSTDEISDMLKLSIEKVDEYIEKTFITFTGIEGNRILQIIQSNFGDCSPLKLRELITKRDLKLQDQLGCILHDRKVEEYTKLQEYFNKFEESRTFLQIDMTLTLEDIMTIKQSDCIDLEQLSVKLHKVQTVIKDYLEQYHPNSIVRKHNKITQISEMEQIANVFGNTPLTFHIYRMIISDSLEVIENLR